RSRHTPDPAAACPRPGAQDPPHAPLHGDFPRPPTPLSPAIRPQSRYKQASQGGVISLRHAKILKDSNTKKKNRSCLFSIRARLLITILQNLCTTRRFFAIRGPPRRTLQHGECRVRLGGGFGLRASCARQAPSCHRGKVPLCDLCVFVIFALHH